MALHPRISHVMTRDGFIWKRKAGGSVPVCVRAEVIAAFSRQRVHGKKDKTSN